MKYLTGKPPYTGATADQILDRAASGDLQAAIDRLEEADVDQELDRLVRHCLEKEPFDRPPNARHVAQQIEQYLRSVESRLEQARIEKAKASTLALNERRTRRMTVALVTSISAAILIGGFFWFSWQQEKQQKVLDATNQLQHAVAQAELLLESAENDPANVADLSRGIAAIELAERIANAQFIATELKEKTLELSLGYQALETDRMCFQELERLRQGPATVNVTASQFDWGKIEIGYQELFKEIAVSSDRQLEPSDVAEWIATKRGYLRESFIVGIDLWNSRRQTSQSRRWWTEVVQLTDDNASRIELRRVLHRAAENGTSDLELELDLEKLSATDASLVSQFFEVSGHPQRAIEILEQTHNRFPGDFWLNTRLV